MSYLDKLDNLRFLGLTPEQLLLIGVIMILGGGLLHFIASVRIFQLDCKRERELEKMSEEQVFIDCETLTCGAIGRIVKDRCE